VDSPCRSYLSWFQYVTRQTLSRLEVSAHDWPHCGVVFNHAKTVLSLYSVTDDRPFTTMAVSRPD